MAAVCGSFRIALIDTITANNSIDLTIATTTALNPDALTVQVGAPAASLVIASDGDIGVGTGTPGQLAYGEEASVHVLRNDGNASILVEETNSTAAARGMLELKNNGGAYITLKNTATNEDWFMSFENASSGRFLISDGVNDGPELALTKEGGLTAQGVISATSLELKNTNANTSPMLLIESTGAGNTTLKIKNSGAVNTELLLQNSAREWKVRNNTIGNFVINTPGDTGFELELNESGDLALEGGVSANGLVVTSASGHAELLMTTGAQSWKLRSHLDSNLVFSNNTSSTSPMKISAAAQTGLLQVGFDASGVPIANNINVGGNLTLSGTLTTAGTTCGGGCDAVFTPDYSLPSIEEHAAAMWEKKYLPNVGPTIENQPINVSEKLGRMLNELETAHIYIAKLQTQINDKTNTSKQKIDRLTNVIDKLEERLNELEK